MPRKLDTVQLAKRHRVVAYLEFVTDTELVVDELVEPNRHPLWKPLQLREENIESYRIQ